MFSSVFQKKNLIKFILISLVAVFASFVLVAETHAEVVAENSPNFGVIKGVVRDDEGNPISNAVVAIFRAGTSKLLKEVRSTSNGSFLVKILPGTYTVLAVAQGFNPSTVSQVQVNRSTELTYGFKLERSGSGNTLPEKKADRNSSKWRVRAAQSRRSIYQAKEGDAPIVENKAADNTDAQANVEESIGITTKEKTAKRRSQSVVETYFANSSQGNYTGFNFATLQPIGENVEIIFAGQTGTREFAPNRFETTVKARPNENHQIRLTVSAVKLGTIKETKKGLGQISFQALDEWKVKDGVILVLGFDYSRFVGAGNDSSFSPRFGLQFDTDAKTRIHTAYTTQTEERTWSNAIELEGNSVFFQEQIAPQAIAIDDGNPLMNKSRRLEFGIERILDNNSNIEATAFFDSVTGRGVGLVNLPLNVLSNEDFAPFITNQHGKTQGVRFVYTRRLNEIFSVSAGYAFGKGQKLSPEAVTNPADIFENAFFQTFVGQINTDLKTGTEIKTIFRLSPQATVFAIDPFQGRLAIYDPGLSILVTQSLPTLGLPIRAKAIIDARNLLDFQTVVNGEQGSLMLNSQRRTLRGGILVRF